MWGNGTHEPLRAPQAIATLSAFLYGPAHDANAPDARVETVVAASAMAPRTLRLPEAIAGICRSPISTSDGAPREDCVRRLHHAAIVITVLSSEPKAAKLLHTAGVLPAVLHAINSLSMLWCASWCTSASAPEQLCCKSSDQRRRCRPSYWRPFTLAPMSACVRCCLTSMLDAAHQLLVAITPAGGASPAGDSCNTAVAKALRGAPRLWWPAPVLLFAPPQLLGLTRTCGTRSAESSPSPTMNVLTEVATRLLELLSSMEAGRLYLLTQCTVDSLAVCAIHGGQNSRDSCLLCNWQHTVLAQLSSSAAVPSCLLPATLSRIVCSVREFLPSNDGAEHDGLPAWWLHATRALAMLVEPAAMSRMPHSFRSRGMAVALSPTVWVDAGSVPGVESEQQVDAPGLDMWARAEVVAHAVAQQSRARRPPRVLAGPLALFPALLEVLGCVLCDPCATSSSPWRVNAASFALTVLLAMAPYTRVPSFDLQDHGRWKWSWLVRLLETPCDLPSIAVLKVYATQLVASLAAVPGDSVVRWAALTRDASTAHERGWVARDESESDVLPDASPFRRFGHSNARTISVSLQLHQGFADAVRNSTANGDCSSTSIAHGNPTQRLLDAWCGMLRLGRRQHAESDSVGLPGRCDSECLPTFASLASSLQGATPHASYASASACLSALAALSDGELLHTVLRSSTEPLAPNSSVARQRAGDANAQRAPRFHECEDVSTRGVWLHNNAARLAAAHAHLAGDVVATVTHVFHPPCNAPHADGGVSANSWDDMPPELQEVALLGMQLLASWYHVPAATSVLHKEARYLNGLLGLGSVTSSSPETEQPVAPLVAALVSAAEGGSRFAAWRDACNRVAALSALPVALATALDSHTCVPASDCPSTPTAWASFPLVDASDSYHRSRSITDRALGPGCGGAGGTAMPMLSLLPGPPEAAVRTAARLRSQLCPEHEAKDDAVVEGSNEDPPETRDVVSQGSSVHNSLGSGLGDEENKGQEGWPGEAASHAGSEGAGIAAPASVVASTSVAAEETAEVAQEATDRSSTPAAYLRRCNTGYMCGGYPLPALEMLTTLLQLPSPERTAATLPLCGSLPDDTTSTEVVGLAVFPHRVARWIIRGGGVPSLLEVATCGGVASANGVRTPDAFMRRRAAWALAAIASLAPVSMRRYIADVDSQRSRRGAHSPAAAMNLARGGHALTRIDTGDDVGSLATYRTEATATTATHAQTASVWSAGARHVTSVQHGCWPEMMLRACRRDVQAGTEIAVALAAWMATGPASTETGIEPGDLSWDSPLTEPTVAHITAFELATASSQSTASASTLQADFQPFLHALRAHAASLFRVPEDMYVPPGVCVCAACSPLTA